MFEPRQLIDNFRNTALEAVSGQFAEATAQVLLQRRHGLLHSWIELLDALPAIEPGDYDFCSPAVRVGRQGDASREQLASLKRLLMQLHPWRKGPFQLFGIDIDSEWRSDMKWRRLERKIQPLHGRLVLDVGCGNGYYICRMLGQGADFVLGVEPSQQYIAQFSVLRKYLPAMRAEILPLKFEEFPLNYCISCGIEFDTVFSMGILYHRREPNLHIDELYSAMRSGGELVMETLIIEGDSGDVLIPGDKYAKMSNVWSIPSEPELQSWLRGCGFRDIRTIDISTTTTIEQRRTDWMTFESLDDFLDPRDSQRTVEGYQAPLRILVSCIK